MEEEVANGRSIQQLVSIFQSNYHIVRVDKKIFLHQFTFMFPNNNWGNPIIYPNSP
jgi:hypothetical protein